MIVSLATQAAEIGPSVAHDHVTDAVAALANDFIQINFVPVALGLTDFGENQASLTFEVVPEPSTILLLAAGLAGLAAARQQRQ